MEWKQPKTNTDCSFYLNERKSEQAYIPHAPTLLGNAAHNEWQCHAIGMGNLTEIHNQISILL